MAGYTNPLDDLYTRRDGLDPNIYTPPQRPRRSSFETFLDSLDEQDRMAEEAAARQQELAAGSNLGAPKETGFGGLRKAEAEMAAQQALQEEIQADPEGWIAKQREQLEANRALLDAYTQETLGLDPTRDAATINQRTEQIRIARNEMDAQAKALGEFEAEVQAAMQATPEDQGFLASALGGINDALEWKPVKSVIEFLSGPQEMLTGLASYPAEWLAAATGANTKFTPATAEDWAEHVLTGGIGSAVNPDNALRQRGREFTELVARTLNVSGLGTTGTGQKFVADMSPVATWVESYFDGDEFGAGGNLDEMTMTMGYALVTDPAMLIDAGVPVGKVLGTGSRFVGKNAMKLKPVADFVAKHPEFINKPQRFWLRMTGEAKKADVLGNEKLTEIYLHEQAFNQTASTEALRFQAQLKHDTRRILNDLTEAQRAEVFEKLPTLVENPTYREFSKAGLLDEPLSADKQVEQALYDYAEVISTSNADILAMEQRWGLKTAELAEDFEYFGRQFSDELLDFFARQPDARKAWLGTKARQSRESLRSALEAPEQARKLRGQGFEESERTMREALKQYGLPDDVPIWGRDASEALLKRSDRMLEAAKVRNLTARAAEVYGFTPDGAEDLARSVVRVAADNSEAARAKHLADAEAELAAALQLQDEFRVGREAIRSVGPKNVSIPRKLTDALELIDPDTTPLSAEFVKRMNPNSADDVAKLRDLLRQELADRPGLAARQANELGMAGARASEVRLVAAESQQGTRTAYQMGRDAENKAVQVAEALRDEATDLVTRTPGAVEARGALKEARKMLAAARTAEDMQEAAAALANVYGFSLPTGATHDAVEVAELGVRYVEDYIASNPAIKNADQALRAANKMLADARQIASKVETFELQRHVGDLLASAEAASDVGGIGAKYLTNAMRTELRKAMKVIDEVADYYTKRAAGAKPKDLEHVNRTVRDVRATLARMRSELRKDAPAALLRTFERAEAQAAKVANAVEDAQGLASKPIAQMVNQRVRDAERALDAAKEAASKGNIEAWSADAKAEFVLARLREQGLAPNPGQMTALELMKRANVKLPDSLEELAYLGTKYLDEADGKEFAKYAKNHYWQHLDKPGKFWSYYDALKGIYQRSTLARVASLTKDLLGTSTQSFMAGNVEELPAALKALGGFNDWRQGIGASDEVLQLKAAGVLRTTKGEARTGKGAFEGVPLVGKIEQSGMIGGTLRAARAEKLGTKVGETFGALNDARVYWEEANRVATFMKARKAGMGFDEAVQEVYKYWGKFDELSRFERTVLNRIMFFWSWMARSVPTALRSTLEHPVRARLLLTLMAGNVTGNDDMPEWMQRMGGVILGQNEDGSFNVINTGSSTYFSPTMSALQSDMMRAATNGRFDEAIVEAGREVTRSAPPFVTGIYERLNQKETFTNRDWYADPNNKIGSQVKAPAMFYWMEGTAVGNWLGIESVTEETPEGVRVKSVVMDPEVANTLSFIPGLEPAMNDVGSFLDPRGQPNADISPGKGLMRTVGVPLYSVIGENDTQRKALQFRKSLNKSIDQMPGNALTSNGKDIYPNKDSKRGRELADAKARLEQKAKDNGLGPRARKAWVLEQLRAVYPAEAEIMELDERLNLLEDVAEAQKEGATLSPLEGAQPLGSLAPRFERQDIREARARMR